MREFRLEYVKIDLRFAGSKFRNEIYFGIFFPYFNLAFRQNISYCEHWEAEV